MILQAAVLAFQGPRVCVVTSSSGKRWGIPKGKVAKGESILDAALRESWEEAGVRGIPSSEPMGTYEYEKDGLVHHVTVFRLEVTEVADEWPEKLWRLREWLERDEALLRVGIPALRQMLRLSDGAQK